MALPQARVGTGKV